MKKLNLLFIAVFMLLLATPASAAWWDSDYQYKTCINWENMDTGRDLTVYKDIVYGFDHAALVTAGKSLESGDDVALVYQDTTEVNYDNTTSFNLASTKIVFMPVANQTAGSSNTDYCLYYGKVGATTAERSRDVDTVYGASTSAAYYGDQNTNEDRENLTTENHACTNVSGVWNYSNAIDCQSQNSAYLKILDVPEVQLQDFCFSFWYKAHTNGADEFAFGYRNGASQRYGICIGTNIATYGISINMDTSEEVGSSATVTVDQWEYWQMCYKQGAITLIEKNGVNVTSSGDASAVIEQDFTTDMAIGARLVSGSYNAGVNGTLDDIRISNSSYQRLGYVWPLPVLTPLTEESSAAPEITVASPTNLSSSFGSSVFLNYSVSGAYSSYNVSIFVDGSFEKSEILDIDTDDYFHITGLLRGDHQVLINASNETQSTVVTVNVTLDNHNVTQTGIAETAYETNRTNFSLKIDVAYDVADISAASLYWNNTEYPATLIDNNVSYTAITNVTIPVIATNNSNISVYWQFTVNHAAPIGAVQFNTTAKNQTLFYNYYILNTSAPSWALETEIFDADAWIYDRINLSETAATIQLNVTFNGTTISLDETGVASAEFTAPQWNGTLNITYDFYVDGYFRSTENRSLGIYTIILNNCSGVGTPTLRFWIKEEENRTLINATGGSIEIRLNATIDSAINRSFAFSMYNNNTLDICIYPVDANVTVDATIQYNGTGFYPRNYYLDQIEITNQTNEIDLYLGGDTSILFHVTDNSGTEDQEDVIIKIQRWYIGSDSYATVAMVKTDFDGEGHTYLVWGTAWYRFVLERNGQVLRTFNPRQIIDSTLVLPLSEDSSIEYWQYYDDVAYSCSYNNDTGTLACTISDTSGLMQSVNLLVQEKGATLYTTTCNVTETSSTSTMYCTGLNNSRVYRYILMATFQETRHVLESGFIEPDQEDIYNLTGLLMTFIIISVLGFLGLSYGSATHAISLFSLGLILCKILGLLVISTTGLISLVLVLWIVAYKVK